MAIYSHIWPYIAIWYSQIAIRRPEGKQEVSDVVPEAKDEHVWVHPGHKEARAIDERRSTLNRHV